MVRTYQQMPHHPHSENEASYEVLYSYIKALDLQFLTFSTTYAVDSNFLLVLDQSSSLVARSHIALIETCSQIQSAFGLLIIIQYYYTTHLVSVVIKQSLGIGGSYVYVLRW